ncbi:MAG: hypothetical protein V3T88_08415, partial [Nitrosomonadaceae bacterium]
MVDATNFTDHANVKLMIEEAQSPEMDNRNLVQEQKTFILDTMWDETVAIKLDANNRYRGEFDQISPILDQISGEMDNAEFAIEVSPAG